MTKRTKRNGTIAVLYTVITIGILLAMLAGCNGGNPTTATQPIAQVMTIADVRGTLITGNVGSSALTVYVDGRNPETIDPGNETARALSAGLYLVTFRNADGRTIADCTYRDLIINASAETGAYCAE